MKWARYIDPERNRKELPWDLGRLRSNDMERPDPEGLMIGARPQTKLQALMETAPGAEPVDSVEDLSELRELLADALEVLDARDLWIFTAHVNRGLSFRQIGAELNLAKSHVHRIYRKVCDELAYLLADEPLIVERLGDVTVPHVDPADGEA